MILTSTELSLKNFVIGNTLIMTEDTMAQRSILYLLT